MKLNRVRQLISLIFLLLIISCAHIKTGSHADQNVSINEFKNFSWISDDPMIIYNQTGLMVSPLTKKYIKDSIIKALTEKGYRYSPTTNQVDFVLSFSVGTRKKVNLNYYPHSYRGHWDWYWQGDYHNTENWHVRTWTEGTLMIDIFDEKSKEPVWHGWATKAVTTKDKEKPSESINKAVAAIFKDFPRSK